MASRKKTRKPARGAVGAAQERLLDTVHQVWLAGLGAVSKAQRGAPRMLDELIAEGARVHADVRGSAEKALRGVLGDVQTTLNARMKQVRGQAGDAFENLEKIFQTRVHRALTQLGVPSADEIAALSKRVDALNASVGKLGRARARPRARAGSRAHPPATP